MNKTKELKIDNALWATPSKLINLLDFNPDKMNIKTENRDNDIKVHYVRYDHGGFCLVIEDLKGCFDFSHNLRHLNLLFDDDNKQNKYYQTWKEILKTVNRDHGKIIKSEEIRLFNNELPIGYVFKINSITIVIESLIEKNDIFYPEIMHSIKISSQKIKFGDKEVDKKILFI